MYGSGDWGRGDLCSPTRVPRVGSVTALGTEIWGYTGSDDSPKEKRPPNGLTERGVGQTSL